MTVPYWIFKLGVYLVQSSSLLMMRQKGKELMKVKLVNKWVKT